MTTAATPAELETRLRRAQAPRAKRKKFLYFLAHDAFRLSVAAETLERELARDPRISAESIDSLFRHLVEKAIVAEFVARTPGDEVIDRFSKTNAKDWKKTWVQTFEHPNLTLDVSELPKTSEMARGGSPELAVLYSKLSHLVHPRLARPYTMVESANHLEFGESPTEFARERSTVAVRNMQSLALHVVILFEREPEQ